MKPFAAVIACVVVLQTALAFQLDANSTSFHVPRSKVIDHQLGSSEWLSSGGPEGNTRPWPRRRGFSKIGEGDKTIIPYCFVDERSYRKLDCKVKSAIKLWSDVLGKAGPVNGHSLAILTHPPSKQHDNNPYCCDGYYYGKEGTKRDPAKDMKCISWNSNRYPSDTLTIHWVDNVKIEGMTSSSMGYTAGSMEGRNSLYISEGNDSPTTIAHELGHTLGMGHEHQRWDRDDYVQFNCKNVNGIKDAVQRVKDEGSLPEDQIWDMLCNHAEHVVQWKAPTIDWVRGDGLAPGTTLNGPDGFDYDSIMMYSSFDGSEVDDSTKDTAVLVKAKKDSAGNKYVDWNDWELPDPQRVSKKDASFVRRVYPWGKPWVPPKLSADPEQPPVVINDPPPVPPRPSKLPPPLPPRPSKQPPPLPPRPSKQPPPLPPRPSKTGSNP